MTNGTVPSRNWRHAQGTAQGSRKSAVGPARARRRPDTRTCRALVVGAALVVGSVVPASASTHPDDQVGVGVRHRAGHVAGVAAGPFDVVGGPPAARAYGLSVAMGFDFGVVGRADSLRALLPGYWPIRVGRSPALDLDHDGLSNLFDTDDDGDGLLDDDETGTGVFASTHNTGTSSVRADSDRDGYSDGAEVAAGTNPNDPISHPAAAPPSVPTLFDEARVVLLILLLGLGPCLPRRWRST